MYVCVTLSLHAQTAHPWLTVRFNERAREDFLPRVCVCVEGVSELNIVYAFTCNEHVFALSLCIRVEWRVVCGGAGCACVLRSCLEKKKQAAVK